MLLRPFREMTPVKRVYLKLPKPGLKNLSANSCQIDICPKFTYMLAYKHKNSSPLMMLLLSKARTFSKIRMIISLSGKSFHNQLHIQRRKYRRYFRIPNYTPCSDPDIKITKNYSAAASGFNIFFLNFM